MVTEPPIPCLHNLDRDSNLGQVAYQQKTKILMSKWSAVAASYPDGRPAAR
ncbi:MAG: hypothetical protein QOG75_2855 [Mycobacterium sp.]|nr:hypothetical protein [Mycobacterium sp.]